jgi:hypothetical protein
LKRLTVKSISLRRAALVRACEMRAERAGRPGMVRVEYRSSIDRHHVVASCTTLQRTVWYAAMVAAQTARHRLAQIGGGA